ncbi:MAG: dTDP-glucose 4,6-dehydratase [Verrucomicrobia bacterium]|nr:dTDP-glucose 4,6-dehydratase [Verrucomicrobiota bacterium]
MRLLVTGGCGFIGSNFIRYVLEHYDPEFITNVDALTYAGSPTNTADLPQRFEDRYEFVRADIADPQVMEQVLSAHSYYAVINFAAESHVDRSIATPQHFVHSNVVGVGVLLEGARRHGVKRFVQVSSDEVYGPAGDEPCTEDSRLNPSSPYSASKAAADLLALACFKTFGQDVVITRGSNNYGPYQYPEKLIPLTIVRALDGQAVPVYGDGLHRRDWLYVEDYCSAIFTALMNGKAGEIYNVASGEEWANLDLIRMILELLGVSAELLQHVPDRPAHDRRYWIDTRKIREELGWKPMHRLEASLPRTIRWYEQSRPWWYAALRAGSGAT